MWAEKINFLDNVKHDIAKTKIQKILNEKNLTVDDIHFINTIIHCDDKRTSYQVILRHESFTIFDDGTELK